MLPHISNILRDFEYDYSQINDLGLVPCMGEYSRHNQVVKRVRDSGKIDILALGGSITAGGYYLEFVNSLREKSNLTVTVHNHGHGATEITCEQRMSTDLSQY